MKRALQIVLGLGIVGACFSGMLSYRELFGAAATCPSPGTPGTLLGYPACVYGFLMFVLVVAVSAAGLIAGRKSASRPHLVGPATPRPVPRVGLKA